MSLFDSIMFDTKPDVEDGNKPLEYYGEIMEESNDFIDMFLEAGKETHYIQDYTYPKVEAILDTPKGDRQFRDFVRDFMDRNSAKLHTSGPVYLIPFTDEDKGKLFELFKIPVRDLKHCIDAMTSSINDKAGWKLIKQNSHFCIIYECIRYYTLKKNQTGINTALAIFALAVYPSVFSIIFKYGANPDVMQYTIDNLSGKYIIKNAGSIFNALMVSIQNSYKFLEKAFLDGSDAEVIRFISRIRNDQKSMIKNIGNNYYQNYEKGLRASTQQERYSDGQLVDDSLNNTTVVEDVSRKVVFSIISNGIDLARVTAAARASGISMADLRFYLQNILIKDKDDELSRFIEAILFIYLYQEKHKPSEINEQIFLKFALDLFRRTNSQDENVVTIKEFLQKWSEDSGVTQRFRREASQINYKKGIFMYIILCIQYYNA